MLKRFLIGLLAALFVYDATAEELSTTKNADKYTFSDFFDAIELPAMFGVGFSPYGLEDVALVTTVRVGWRYHKVYGIFAGVVYENHIHAYNNLDMSGTNPEYNLLSGDIAYNDVGVFVGYRLPLVRDLKAFFAAPRHVPCNIYLSVQPTITIPDVMHASFAGVSGETDVNLYELTHKTDKVVPSMKFNIGFEWFIVDRFSVAAEVGYLQHCIPTVLEQAAIDAGKLSGPAGQMNVGIALSVLFK